jgi:hypothetical protein
MMILADVGELHVGINTWRIPMNNPNETNVINIPQTQVSFENMKYLTHFEMRMSEIVTKKTL